MIKVCVGSQNPVKLKCIKLAFEEVFSDQSFEFVGNAAPSSVPDQPMTDQETYTGALNRVNYCKKHYDEADYYVGIEGGIDYHDQQMIAFAWICIVRDNQMGTARTATFQIPDQIAALVSSGVELGTADDMVFGRSNSKTKDGAVGILTNGTIDRTRYYKEAAILALIPFLNPELFNAS